MSLWWARREQLDRHQVNLIENLRLNGDYLVIGPPGSGKTNVLLRRAQFVRMQGSPNTLLLTFTRALTEFVRTGCQSPNGRELFPPALITTVESWLRGLYRTHDMDLPEGLGPVERRATMATGALAIIAAGRVPLYDALFVDEAQDLLREEVEAIRAFGRNLFFVGDDRQKIYGDSSGLAAIRHLAPSPEEHTLPFHYRLAPEICRMADRIQVPSGVDSLTSTQQYEGPTPGRISVEGPLSRAAQMEAAASRLRDQIRVYGDLIRQGDRLGVIVPRKDDREALHTAFQRDAALRDRSQIVRARDGSTEDRSFVTALDLERPILIVTAPGAKGLEFRAVQWLFSDDLERVYTPEIYYTVVTRAKTSLDIYYTNKMPEQIAKAYTPPEADIWQ